MISKIKVHGLKFNIFAVLLLLSVISFAQINTDERVATLYFEKGEYDKAVVLFEKLFDKSPTEHYYTFYMNCLLQLKDFKTCEKFIKKQVKRQPTNLKLLLDLGSCYTFAIDPIKAQKEFDKAIEKVPENQQSIVGLANNFVAIGLTDYAIKTYLHGREKIGFNYPFCFELAEVYNNKGDVKSAIGEYLEAIHFNESYTSQVQNALQTEIGEDAKGERTDLLKGELLKKIQQYPNEVSYTEMLSWLFIQQKNFVAAFDQIKALDKRLGENTGRVFNLANLCVSNGDYETAATCFQYEIDKGKISPYYQQSRVEYVKAMNQKLTQSGFYNQVDLLQLKNTYLNIINEFGVDSRTIDLQRGLAHLFAFYLFDTDTAINILNNVITLAGIEPKTVAECKLELADIILFTGEIWEPSLLYSQVEKAFKQEPIGQEAKFRNARLSYYQGDFEWAQGQLTVLKAATSKLIANDALDLSLLIMDNMEDSVSAPLHIFSRAELLMFQNKDSLAILALDSINNMFPETSLNDDILYKKYKINLKQAKYEVCKNLLETLIAKYGTDVLADDATFSLGELYQYKLKNTEAAKKQYEKVLTEYPGSLYTVEARKRFRKLRGDNVN